jgi:D-alanine-D-alanine ligase
VLEPLRTIDKDVIMPRTGTADFWRVALLAGGDSEERAISLESGQTVEAALSSRGHLVVPLDPAVVELSSVDWSQFDVAFLALHGRFGEDGQVQQMLEQAGMPFTGSDASASRLAFSKSAAKERFAQFGVPTPPYALVHYADDAARIERMVQAVGYPLVVKPDAQGSSLGVTIVREPSELPAALQRCFEYDSFGVIEQAILGSEWTVALFDDLVLPPIRIETPREFFDYQAKYHADDTRYLFDTDWPHADVQRIADVAAEAAKSLGVQGVSRVDLRVDAARLPWVLEVNTIPGFTSHSLVPKAAARMGIEFAELCERAIRACLSGRPRRPHLLHNASARRHVS